MSYRSTRQARHYSLPTSLFCIASHLTRTWTSLRAPRCLDRPRWGWNSEKFDERLFRRVPMCVVASGKWKQRQVVRHIIYHPSTLDSDHRCRIGNANKGVSSSSPPRDIAHLRSNALLRLIATLRNMIAGKRPDARYSDWNHTYCYRTLAPHDFRCGDSKTAEDGPCQEEMHPDRSSLSGCVVLLGNAHGPIVSTMFKRNSYVIETRSYYSRRHRP